MPYSIGLDFGTNSCRSLLIDLADGSELGSAVFDYPSGTLGILTDPADPHLARQHPKDYLDGLTFTIREALAQAAASRPGFGPAEVVGIGVDTTGSTPMPVDAHNTPLALLPQFSGNPHAHVWLWKDHTGHAEAAEITALAAQIRPNYLARCGGTYSSEWWWSKILRCRRVAPEVFAAAHSWVEHCDLIPAILAGITDPAQIRRGICAAGHKAMFHPAWGGLPDEDFLAQLHPDLAALRPRLYSQAHTADTPAGTLCQAWADKLGLPPGITIAVGAFDAHMGAVGAGIEQGTLVKILGTSTCDLMVAPESQPLQDIPGVCGIVEGSVLPGFYGIEAGQSAVGDIFLWLVHHLVPDSYGSTPAQKFAAMEQAMADQPPGAHGLLALDWNNGNRTILTDARLSGLILGQSLHTQAHEIYRALIEATAFGALRIVERIEEYGVPVRQVINTGGLASKNPTLMQIYADVLGRPMRVSRSEQTCALGAAICAAAAAGHAPLAEIQAATTATRDHSYHPDPAANAIYQQLYALYKDLHDAFGTTSSIPSSSLAHIMKRLLEIRDHQRAAPNPKL